CRDMMLQHGNIDACISDVLTTSSENPTVIGLASRLAEYQDWRSNKTAIFTFSDVSLLLRRSSLSYLGLYDTQFKMIDWEYSLRITYLEAKIAYYTAYNAMAVDTPGNITSVTSKTTKKFEENIGRIKYGYSGDEFGMSLLSKIKVWIGETYDNMKNLKNKQGASKRQQQEKLESTYAALYRELEELNKKAEGTFIL